MLLSALLYAQAFMVAFTLFNISYWYLQITPILIGCVVAIRKKSLAAAVIGMAVSIVIGTVGAVMILVSVYSSNYIFY